VVAASVTITLPTMDLIFHELAVFITSLHFGIDSNRLFGVNLFEVSDAGII
jgi:hypothetical protein